MGGGGGSVVDECLYEVEEGTEGVCPWLDVRQDIHEFERSGCDQLIHAQGLLHLGVKIGFQYLHWRKIRTDLETIAFHRGTSLNVDKIMHRFCFFSFRCVVTVRKIRKSAGACNWSVTSTGFLTAKRSAAGYIHRCLISLAGGSTPG